MSIPSRLNKVIDNPWFFYLVILAGFLVFFLQLWVFAHTQRTVLDEGVYLFEGLLFSIGRYRPFQDYGMWGNQMPFAFLIPGWIQTIFGAGLRTGRYFAVVLAMLNLTGLYIVSRRLGNNWLAAGAVWIMALNPAISKMYSMAVSEGLVACILIWIMVLTLGGKRPIWQLVLGSMLAGLVVMIRINMLPLLPLLVAYIYWQYGPRAGLWSLIGGSLVVLITHYLYWPNILRIWAFWFPSRLTPFLETWRPPSGVIPYTGPEISFSQRIYSFFHSFRYHFVALAGVIVVWLLWPKRENWKSVDQYRTATFLSVTFASLALIHIVASLGKNFCVFCYPIYTSFYVELGILLLVVSYHGLIKSLSWLRSLLALIIMLTLIGGISFSFTEMKYTIIARILSLSVPRISSLTLLSGQIKLWELIANRFGLAYKTIAQISLISIATLIGILLVTVILLIALIIRRVFDQKDNAYRPSPVVLGLWIFLILGLLLSPTKFLGNSYHDYDCGGDLIVINESVGNYLASIIPPKSKVYWRAYSPVSLLYLPDVQIYPPQLHSDYTYWPGGDPDELLRYGWWNDALSRQWVEETDYILIEDVFHVEFKTLIE